MSDKKTILPSAVRRRRQRLLELFQDSEQSKLCKSDILAGIESKLMYRRAEI